MTFNQKEFGERIKEQRIKLGLTQEELALKLNISYEHMNKIERAKHGCSIDILLELSIQFGVSTDYLLTGKSYHDVSVRETVSNVVDELTLLLGRLEDRMT